jgi:uncharacterized RDD family membrane protein YckC
VSFLVRRLIAFLLDQVVLFAVLAMPQFLIAALSGSWFLDESSSNVLIWAWVGISVTVPSLIYFVVSDASKGGTTLGKRVLGLSVCANDRSRVSLGQSVLRNIVKLIPWEATHIMIIFPEPFGDDLGAGKIALMIVSNILLVVWLIAPILDRPRCRALHDRVARTRVTFAHSPHSEPAQVSEKGL